MWCLPSFLCVENLIQCLIRVEYSRVHIYYSVWDIYANTSNPKLTLCFFLCFDGPTSNERTKSPPPLFSLREILFDHWKWKPSKSNQNKLSQYVCWSFRCIDSCIVSTRPYRCDLIWLVFFWSWFVIVIIFSISIPLCFVCVVQHSKWSNNLLSTGERSFAQFVWEINHPNNWMIRICIGITAEFVLRELHHVLPCLLFSSRRYGCQPHHTTPHTPYKLKTVLSFGPTFSMPERFWSQL